MVVLPLQENEGSVLCMSWVRNTRQAQASSPYCTLACLFVLPGRPSPQARGPVTTSARPWLPPNVGGARRARWCWFLVLPKIPVGWGGKLFGLSSPWLPVCKIKLIAFLTSHSSLICCSYGQVRELRTSLPAATAPPMGLIEGTNDSDGNQISWLVTSAVCLVDMKPHLYLLALTGRAERVHEEQGRNSRLKFGFSARTC